MKKLLYIFTVLFTCVVSAQQEFSYGVELGNSFYTIGNNNGTTTFETEDKVSSFVIGGYSEYNFTENIGIKVNVLFSKKEFIYFPNKQIFTMNFVDIAPNFKYDFGETYRDGFYMLIGPKISLITNAKSEGEDVKDSFETFNLGAQLGFGWRIFKFVDIQTKLDYELTPFFKLNNGNKSNFFGAVISANIDLAKVF
jgi:hypothetical protein